MCVITIYINHSFLKKIYKKLKKLLKKSVTFSFFYKKISKII